MNREAIDVALWNLLTSDPRVQGQFQTMSRYTQHHENVALLAMPALFMLQEGETWARPGKGMSPKRTLKRRLWLYASTSAPTVVYPATIINAMLDVIDDVLTQPGTPDNTVTLGGLVEHVYIDGEIVIAEGLLQSHSLMHAPITILVP